MGWRLHLARLEEERKAWVLNLFLKEKGSSLLKDNFKSIKERKRTQSWFEFNRRQPHVLGTCYYSGISPPIVSETLQGLPYSVAQIQSDTGLSTKLLNSVLLGSISSSQVVSCTMYVSHGTCVNLYRNLLDSKHRWMWATSPQILLTISWTETGRGTLHSIYSLEISLAQSYEA